MSDLSLQSCEIRLVGAVNAFLVVCSRTTLGSRSDRPGRKKSVERPAGRGVVGGVAMTCWRALMSVPLLVVSVLAVPEDVESVVAEALIVQAK